MEEMAKRPSPIFLFGKWVIVPILMGLLGYFILGPRIGKDISKTPDKQIASTGSGPEITPDEAPKKPARHSRKKSHVATTDSAPEADVTVDADSGHRPSAATHKKPADDQLNPDDKGDSPVVQNSDHSSDQGGSGGAATAGQT